MNYQSFLAEKTITHKPSGVSISHDDLSPLLFDFQKDIVRWSLAKGRAAIFADCGLGKAFMSMEFARLTGQKTLIIAPLSVARQFVREGEKFGIPVEYRRQDGDLPQITVTNYEMVDSFDPSQFGCVVLDESSILKGLTSKTRQRLTEMFSGTPYKLCCTATPAPNDITEIANHADYLGVMTRAEMLASFFIHDMTNGSWRLKRHAVKGFYKWLASWSIAVRKPSDLGYPDDGYILPKLSIHPHFIKSDYVPEGQLFHVELKGITDRARVRRETHELRCEAAAKLINGDNNQWIVWCGLNDESRMMAQLIPDSVEVYGSLSPDEKISRIESFQDGETRVLVTKPGIAGHGMNFQNCHNMVFVGMNDSAELYYQSIRRCYRFGQEKPVNAHIVLTDIEKPIYRNVMQKELMATELSDNLLMNMGEYTKMEIGTPAQVREWKYKESIEVGDNWEMRLGDSCERITELTDNSVGLSVFSPPFQSLYTYSPTERDLGNSKSQDDFFSHFSFIIKELLRVTMPGRLCAVHCANIASMVQTDGFIGLKDFRGDIVRQFIADGWIYHSEICIQKNPQISAIRTKAKGLLFKQLHKDAAWSRQAIADYICVFRKPGDNPEPVTPDISNEDWIEWAAPVWLGITETDVLKYQSARGQEDERHICPLQLGVIERCIRLWSNQNDVILDPFTGIGSTGFVAVKNHRRFSGIELKPEYFDIAIPNLRHAESQSKEMELF